MRKELVHPGVIHRPDLQPKSQRMLFRLITMCAWGVWIYLLLPLLSLLVWIVGLDYFRRYMLSAEQVNVTGTLLVYGAMIAAAAIIIVVWSKYNVLRHRYRGRREVVPQVTPEMMCERFNVDRTTLDGLHSGKVVMMDIDEREAVRCTWIHKKL